MSKRDGHWSKFEVSIKEININYGLRAIINKNSSNKKKSVQKNKAFYLFSIQTNVFSAFRRNVILLARIILNNVIIYQHNYIIKINYSHIIFFSFKPLQFSLNRL